MLNTLVALVMAASSLVMQAQSPNVTPEFRAQALSVAAKVLVGVQLQLQLLDDQQQAPALPADPVDATSTPEAPVQNVIVPVTVFNALTSTPAPIVPVCSVTATVIPTTKANKKVVFSWNMDAKASGFLDGYGTLPSYTSYVPHPPAVSVYQTASSTTYTLTETINDSAYQHTTTCEVTVTL